MVGDSRELDDDEGIWDRAADNYDEYVTQTRHPPLRRYLEGEREALFNVIRRVAEGHEVSLIDVGCGTGRLLESAARTLVDSEHYSIGRIIGIDISKSMRKKAQARTDKWRDRLVTISPGDATRLTVSLEQYRQYTFSVSKHVVFCMLNTLGIFPRKTRVDIIHQMGTAADNGGTVVVSLFNAASFERQAADLYRTLDPIVGRFEPKDACDIEHANFRNGLYFSHWFDVEDAKLMVSEGLRGTALAGTPMEVTPIDDIAFLIAAGF